MSQGQLADISLQFYCCKEGGKGIKSNEQLCADKLQIACSLENHTLSTRLRTRESPGSAGGERANVC